MVLVNVTNVHPGVALKSTSPNGTTNDTDQTCCWRWKPSTSQQVVTLCPTVFFGHMKYLIWTPRKWNGLEPRSSGLTRGRKP